MSKTIDQRVVEMRFDNKHFEQNVSTTMSTLDKLKKALHFPNASKSLEGINTAAKGVNMSGLSSAVDTVSARFSALQVMGVTALANITNSAVNAGKNIVKALTIDPVTTGLNEYETKINAIQVIQSNTRGKNSMDEIKATLNELNDYADKTIYNFAQMTSNVGKFTAQGFKVQDAANAVKGLANLAAASGASAEDMARATYQMSQALGSSIKLMDWNSLRNANMATQELKDTLIALAKTHGVAIDQMIEDEGTFEYTLQNGWLTGEMFTEAMNIYSGVYSEAELAAKGFTQSQIDNFMELAKNAESAATEVKTFTQLWDVLKETAQSGWTQTWELFIGDFETAKADLTRLQTYFSDIINGWSDARNTLFGGALDPMGTWTKIVDKLDKSGLGKIKEMAENISNVTDKLEHFQDIVSKVWRGDFGNSDTGRFELLEKAGYDHRVVQDLVNKGHDYKLTIEDVEASHKKFGLTLKDTTDSAGKAGAEFGKLTDKQLENAGLTKAEIKLYRELEAEAAKTGQTVSELVEDMSKKDGREMLIESLKNGWSGLVTVLKSAKDAFVDIFPPMTVVQLYKLIEGINEFSKHLVVSEETADKLTRTFKGVFALFDVMLTIVGGPLKWAFDAAVQLLAKFDLNILDITAAAGDAIVKFRDWVDENNLFVKGLELITPYLKSAAESFRDWIDKLKTSENLPEDIAKGIISGFGKALKFIKSVFSNIGEYIGVGFDSIPNDVLTGLANGLMKGAHVVWDVMMIIGKTILQKIRDVLGIHSPSTEFFEIGKYIILGLFNGIKETVKMVYELIMSVAQKIVETFKTVDPGTLIAAALSAGMIAGFLKIGTALKNFSEPLEGVSDILENTGRVLKSFSGVLKSFSMSIKAKALQSIAIALAILVGAVIAMTFVNPVKLLIAVGILTLIAGLMAGLTAIIGKFGAGDATDIAKFSFLMLSISAALLIVAGAVKLLESIDTDKAKVAFGGLAGVVLAIGLVLTAYGTIVKGKAATNIAKFGSMLFLMSTSLLILVGVIKLIGGLSKNEVLRGSLALTAFVGIFALLAKITTLGGKNVSKLGGMLVKMSAAMLILAFVMKIIATMSVEEIVKGGVAILAFVGIFALLALISKIGGTAVKGLGTTLLGMALAIGILILIAKLVSGMSVEDMIKGGLVVAAFALILRGLIAATDLAGPNAKGLGATLLAMSVAIGILAGIAVLLSLVDTKSLVKGIIAVGFLSLIMSMLVASTGLAQSCVGNLVVITIAIAVLAAAVAALSMIETEKLIIAAGALAILMGAFALINFSTKDAQKMTGTLLGMVVVVGLLGGLIALLSTIMPDNAITTAGSIAILLTAMSVSLSLLSGLNKPASSAIISIAAMGLVVLELGGILKLLEVMNIDVAIEVVGSIAALMLVMSTTLLIASKAGNNALQASIAMNLMSVVVLELGGILKLLDVMNIDTSIETVASISALLLAMSAALVIASAADKDAVRASAAMAIMGGVVAEIGIVLGIMSGLGVEASIPTALALSILLNAMAAALVIASAAGPNATKSLPALAAMGLVVAEIAIILGVMQAFDVAPSIETAAALGILLASMSASLLILSGVGVVASGALAGIGILALLVAEIGLLIAAMGKLVDEFPQLETFLDKGIPILEKIGYGLGAFFGNIIGGFTDGATAGLPAIGTHLSQFMENASGFIEGAKTVDDQMMSGVKAIAETILILTAADILEGLTSWFTGGSSLTEFGSQLGSLGTNLNQFATNLGTFSEDQVNTVTNACNAIKVLAEAANTIPNEGGLWASIVGENSIGAFGAQLGGLGTNLSMFVTNLGTFSEEQVATVRSACDALKALAETAKIIPNEGGLWGSIVGENSIGAFGAQLGSLGTNLKQFVSNLGTFSEEQVATVNSACGALKSLASAAKAIPNEGGLWATLFGDNSISTFGSKLPGLATNLALFVTNLGEFTESQVATVTCACNAIKALANMSKAVSGGEDIWDKLFGDNSLSKFSGNLPTLGTNLATFVANLGEFSDGQVSTVNAAVKAINALANLSDTDLKATTKNISGFGSEIVDLGKDIASFASNLNDGTSVTDAVANLEKIVKSTAEVVGANTEAIANFGEALRKLGDKGVESFTEAFTDSNALSGVKDAAKKFVGEAIKGIEDKKGDVEDASEKVAKAGSSAIKTWTVQDAWKGAGKYCVQGFADGIKANKSIATAAAEAVAAAALKAAKAKLKEHSPSKAFYEVGDYAGLGFVNALYDYESISYDAGSEMAGSAMVGLKSSISKIGDLINSDMDVQPIIRPVLDLTDVETRASSIGDILGNQSVGVKANASAISAMMNRRGQNGANDDVVSAIDKLGKHIDNMPRESYSIGSISSGGDVEVEEAIQTLVRYAKLERRR